MTLVQRKPRLFRLPALQSDAAVIPRPSACVCWTEPLRGETSITLINL